MCPSALQGCKANQAHTDTHPTKSGWDSSNAKLAKRSFKGKGVGGFRGMVRFCEGWVWNEELLTEVSEKRKGYGKCGNPSGSRPIFCGDSTSPLTREASVMAIFEGLLSFCNCCGNGSIRCNGRSKQGKDALACVPKCFARMQSQPSTHRHSSYEKREG